MISYVTTRLIRYLWTTESVLSSFLSPHLSQHVVPPENRPMAECLPALRTAVFTLLLLSIPAMLNAAFTITVSTINGDGFFQKIQTHWTGKLNAVQVNSMWLILLTLLLARHFSCGIIKKQNWTVPELTYLWRSWQRKQQLSPFSRSGEVETGQVLKCSQCPPTLIVVTFALMIHFKREDRTNQFISHRD